MLLNVTNAEYNQAGPNSIPENEVGWRRTSYLRGRDSDCLAESNFHAICALLAEKCGPEGEEAGWIVERHGHWAVGWLECIAYKWRGNGRAKRLLKGCKERLDDYPVLDEEDFSEREREQQYLTIECCAPIGLRLTRDEQIDIHDYLETSGKCPDEYRVEFYGEDDYSIGTWGERDKHDIEACIKHACVALGFIEEEAA